MVIHLETFPERLDFDGLSLCFYFGRWCCLHAELYGLNYFHHGSQLC